MCMNAILSLCACLRVGIEGLGKQSLAAYILLKHELGQQGGNLEPLPYCEQCFPEDGGQKERKA